MEVWGWFLLERGGSVCAHAHMILNGNDIGWDSCEAFKACRDGLVGSLGF